MTILPLAYLPGIEWFTRLAAEDCIIDIGENWVKQTARNRAEILSVNGVQTLTVPVHADGGYPSDNQSISAKISTKDVRIDNSKKWQHQHWISLVSAYRGSPFFEHYEHLFSPVFSKKLNYLTDLNIELLNILTGILGLTDRVQISDTYVIASPGDTDLREKKALRRENLIANNFTPEYTQVFSDRMPFQPGLSVVDLIFCEGCDAARALQ